MDFFCQIHVDCDIVSVYISSPFDSGHLQGHRKQYNYQDTFTINSPSRPGLLYVEFLDGH